MFKLRVSHTVLVILGLIMCLFFLSPIFALMLSIVLIATGVCKWAGLKIYALIMSIFLGVINSTKVPASDMIDYLSMFQMAYEVPFLDYIFSQSKEPAYHLIVYFISKIAFTNDQIFIFFLTSGTYFMAFSALIYLAEKRKLSIGYTALLVTFLWCNPPLFSLSAHLIRQFIAAGFFLYAIRLEGRPTYRNVVFIFSGLVHTSAFILVALYLVSPNDNSNWKKKLVLHAAFIAVSIFILVSVAQLYSGVGPDEIIYITSRLTQAEFFDLGRLGIVGYLFIITTMLISFIAIINKKVKLSMGQYKYFWMCISLGGLLLVSSSQASLSELTIRVSLYYYFLFPISLVFASLRLKINALEATLVCSLTIIFFLAYIPFSVWTYADYMSRLTFGFGA